MLLHPGLLLLLALPLLSAAQDRQADSLILLEIYSQLDGPNWRTSERQEFWNGMTVQDGRVTGLSFINQNVAGPFPEQITGLDQLQAYEVRTDRQPTCRAGAVD